MVLRLKPSVIDFSSIFLTTPCSGNTFNQYMILSLKDDSRDIDWFLFCPFSPSPSCVIGFALVVSATYDLVCSPA